ncbi:MAG: helix-turn-helix domain-containing protein [Candidatus Omnitrophota bacterium]
MNNMLSSEEVKTYLDIEQDELERYLAQGKLHAYKIGGTYVRFRREEVESLRLGFKAGKLKLAPKKGWVGHLGDFWRFNNFYIVSLLLVGLAIFFLIRY